MRFGADGTDLSLAVIANWCKVTVQEETQARVRKLLATGNGALVFRGTDGVERGSASCPMPDRRPSLALKVVTGFHL